MADFDAPVLTIVGLAEFNLPGRDLRLCDGGFIYFGGNKFTSADPDFGSIESVDPIEERSGDEAPSGSLTFLPSSTAAAATLSQPSYQGSRVRFWLGRVNEATGQLAGDPELACDWLLDTTTLRVARKTRRLGMGFVSTADRLFTINEGNVLSSRFHQSVWPGELGMDNAVGIPSTVAWGVTAPPRGSVVVGAVNGFVGALRGSSHV